MANLRTNEASETSENDSPSLLQANRDSIVQAQLNNDVAQSNTRQKEDVQQEKNVAIMGNETQKTEEDQKPVVENVGDDNNGDEGK